jgi:hypothetical protein
MGSVKWAVVLPAQVGPGFRFSTCTGGDADDQDVVTVLEVTPSMHCSSRRGIGMAGGPLIWL